MWLRIAIGCPLGCGQFKAGAGSGGSNERRPENATRFTSTIYRCPELPPSSAPFEFLAGEGRWGIPDPDGDFGPQPIDARKTRLSNIVQETGAKTIHYLYDFGDSWDHVIKLEKWFDNTTTEGLPLLLDATGRCPPEDVGGVPGYADRAGPGCLDSAPLDLSGFLPGYAEREALRFCRCVGRA
ncbi:hypothetical protein ACVMFA_005931 [Bradyrhizobium liaoningense]